MPIYLLFCKQLFSGLLHRQNTLPSRDEVSVFIFPQPVWCCPFPVISMHLPWDLCNHGQRINLVSVHSVARCLFISIDILANLFIIVVWLTSFPLNECVRSPTRFWSTPFSEIIVQVSAYFILDNYYIQMSKWIKRRYKWSLLNEVLW